jgi:1-deoxy-D-xylulose-5-phosphate synthase
MYTAQVKNYGAFAIRFPRGSGVLPDWQKPFKELAIGKGRKISDGKNISILSIGHPGNFVQHALQQLPIEIPKPAHFDLRFVKPLDEELLHEVCKNFDKIITIEDGTINGGFGSAVLEFMANNQYYTPLTRLGVPDKFVEHGSLSELYHECGFDVEGIKQIIIQISGS